MEHFLNVQMPNVEDAKALQQLLNEMGYKTTRYSKGCNVRPTRETRLGHLVIRYLKAHRSATPGDMSDYLIEHGYSPKSASVTLSFLYKQGDVHRIGYGVYSHKERT
jgi:hypothetical protein